MKVRHLLPLTAGAVLALLLTGPAAFAADDDGGAEDDAATTWSLAPGTADGPDTRISLRHVIDPGQSVSDFVVLTNFSPHAATFDVYASDGLVTPAGDFDLLPPGSTPVDGGSWIDVGAVDGATAQSGTLTMRLESAASVVIPIRISVPADATPGDHPAGVVAQFVPEGDGPVQLANRVGVRTHLRVSGDVTAALDTGGVSVTYEMSWNPFAPGTLRVEHRIDNTGNVRLGAEAHVRASGPFGLAPAQSSTQVREVLPGSTTPAVVELDVWPLFVSTGEIAVEPLAVGDDGGVDPVDAATAGFTAVTMPWSQLLSAALVASVVVLGVWARRRGRSRVQQRIDAAVARARAEDATTTQPAVGDAGGAVDARTASRG